MIPHPEWDNSPPGQLQEGADTCKLKAKRRERQHGGAELPVLFILPNLPPREMGEEAESLLHSNWYGSTWKYEIHEKELSDH